ncbi:MAG: nucleotidyltransferase family protein [Hyphomicrobiales bacterium]|nr:nucleotidyltransferase family protein [Hyphomicrobiales bacterium]
MIATLIERLPRLALPDCWLTASALTQTVWNVLDGRKPETGIRDYDVFYYDPDRSWEAEDRVITRAASVFGDVAATIEVRNQARVHLWFDARNGTHGYPKLATSREAIDVFLETPTMFGVRATGNGAFDAYAPRGYDDLFGFVFRPNPNTKGA